MSAIETTAHTKLTPRLAAALEMLGNGEGKTLADIGCDHGKFALAAIKSFGYDGVIMSDISAPSLDKARALFESFDLNDKCSFKCCSGLDDYSEGEADKAALLGMGGELIAAILENGKSVAERFELIVMQPMRGEAELRRYLYKNGYSVIDERIVLDAGRYYQLICAKHSSSENIALPEWFPKDCYQFGAVALQKREKELLPMMQRYLGIIENKLADSKRVGRSPAFLLREINNTKALISLYLGERAE
ncbi:MAG: SAM-dependent methyltransferase [Clostridia bacterium]|nr:SAM-dependent methyltransferase [Clostridia bacterium]